MRKPAVIAKKLHKWLGLVVGVQLLIWLLSGLYMVAVDIDFIHGDTLVRNMQQAIDTGLETPVKLTQLRADYPTASRIDLQAVMGQPFFTVTTPGGRYLVDANNGHTVSPLDEQTSRAVARFHYNGEAEIRDAALITTDAPQELYGRALPLWRIDFDDPYQTSFYIDPYNGSLVTRRHLYWRVFDVLWMLHIMDYEERTDIHHPLLLAAQFAGLALAITGSWVLIYSLSRRTRARKFHKGST